MSRYCPQCFTDVEPDDEECPVCCEDLTTNPPIGEDFLQQELTEFVGDAYSQRGWYNHMRQLKDMGDEQIES